MLRSMTILGLAFVMTAAVSAQDRPRPGRGFGRGGAFGGSPVMLLGMPEVRTELKTTADQNTKLDALQAEQRQQFQDAFAGFDFRNATAEDQQKAQAKGAEIAKKGEEGVAKVLDAKQMERLKQLQLQREGVDALTRPDVAQQVGITADQQSKIKSIQEANRPDFSQFGRLQNATEEDRNKAIAEFRQKREKAQADILAVLTDEQKTKFASMKGAEFKFPEGRGFGRPAPGNAN